MQKFFHTHRCGALCKRLGFPDRSAQKLTARFNNVPGKKVVTSPNGKDS